MKIIDFSTVLNLYPNFFGGVKSEAFMPPKQGVFSLALFPIIIDQYLQGCAILPFWSLRNSPLKPKLKPCSWCCSEFQVYISSLTWSCQNIWRVANGDCKNNTESKRHSWDQWLEKFEKKDRLILVLNLWRRNLYKLY